jgi:hypothetical protein
MKKERKKERKEERKKERLPVECYLCHMLSTCPKT